MGLDIRRILNQFKDVMLIKSFFFFCGADLGAYFCF